MATQPSQLEHGIPLPPTYARRGKYHWREMKVGDSFMVHRPQAELKRTWNNLSSCRAAAQKSTGWVFAIRQVKGGLRVWRIK